MLSYLKYSELPQILTGPFGVPAGPQGTPQRCTYDEKVGSCFAYSSHGTLAPQTGLPVAEGALLPLFHSVEVSGRRRKDCCH